MSTLRVDLGSRSYPIIVGSGLLQHSGELLRELDLRTTPVVVSNARVLRLHGERLLRSLRKNFGHVQVIAIGDGERFKDHSTLQRVYNRMFGARADRHSWVIAFGGGVVGDLAGFAAATFMRGIRYVNIPTTLLAQVDSAIGGKVGINTREGKNLIGAFHQPSAVLSDIDLLKTLAPRELASGLFEVVKCAAIRSRRLMSYLEKHLDEILAASTVSLQHIVLEACRIKAKVVSGDEQEEQLRMILNFGHTVGHALESATEYSRFKHGEAVAWGMVAAVEFGLELGMLDSKEAGRLTSLIHRVETLPTLRRVSFSAAWRALIRDKKFRAGKIRMVLLPRLGECQVRSDLDLEQVRRFLRNFLATRGRPGSTA